MFPFFLKHASGFGERAERGPGAAELFLDFLELAGFHDGPHRPSNRIEVRKQNQQAVLIVMELSVARPVTAAAVEVQVTQEFDERLEILQALDVGYLTTFAHGNPSPAKAVDSAVEPTSLNSGRKFRAEQA
jgi:hypothetical protein